MDDALRALSSGLRGDASKRLRQKRVSIQGDSLELSQAANQALPAVLDFFRDGGSSRRGEAMPEAVQEKFSTQSENQGNYCLEKHSDEAPSLIGYPALDRALEQLGIKTLTPVQKRCIPLFTSEKDVIAVAPTGSGKTLAYTLPLLRTLNETSGTSLLKSSKSTTRSLIIVPTRELAKQVSRVLNRVSVAAHLSFPMRTVDSKASLAALKSAARLYDVIIATPMRLVNALRSGILDAGFVRNVILDEADRLFDDGFISQLDEILAECGTRNPTQRRVHMFSATLPGHTEMLARTVLKNAAKIVVGGGAYGGAAAVTDMAKHISQRFTFVGGRGEQGKVLAVRTLIKEGLPPPILVFVQSKERAAQLFRELVFDGVNVDAIHADRTQAARDSAIARFRSGELWMLIATDLLARGLDFLAVRTVINYDIPVSPTDYVHRIGRTGRNGRFGDAVTLFTEEDAAHLPGILRVARASGAEVPEWALSLRAPRRRDEVKRLEKRPPKRKKVGGPNLETLAKRRRRARVPQQWNTDDDDA